MKKLICALTLICTLLLLTGCHAVTDTEAAIDSIGTVTMDSGEAIMHAQSLFDDLFDFQKGRVDNFDILSAAHDTFEMLHIQVNSTVEKISQIGAVTVERKEFIDEADSLYQALNDQQKSRVSNYELLTQAQQEYARLDGLIQSAKTAILQIGEVTLSSEKDIKAARSAYENLQTDNLTGYLEDEFAVLTAAEAAYERLYIEDLKNQAVVCLEKADYQQALEIYCTLLYAYSDSQQDDEYLRGAADASAGIAQAFYDNGEIEDAKLTLENACYTYTTTDACEKLLSQIKDELKSLRPRNGETFHNNVNSRYNYLKVIAGEYDVCVKLTRIQSPNKTAMFYVHAGDEAIIKLTDGDYELEYATGDTWYGLEEMFGRYTVYIRMEETIEIRSYQKGYTFYYTAYTIDLTPSEDGTMIPNYISPGDF